MTFKNGLKGYKVIFLTRARKELEEIPSMISSDIEKKLRELVTCDTLNFDIKKMSGFDSPTYRLRHGNYRIIYEVHQDKIVVLVVAVGHRQSIYKRYRAA